MCMTVSTACIYMCILGEGQKSYFVCMDEAFHSVCVEVRGHL